MEKYETPFIEVIIFKAEDVITTSSVFIPENDETDIDC